MEPINPYSLEKYAERHRADFDLHEPRPELWAALDKQLHGEAAPERPLLHAASPAPPVVAPLPAWWERWQHYGIAAALAALVVAAGVGENWKAKQSLVVVATPAGRAALGTGSDAALYTSEPAAILAAQSNGADDARLDTAVHGMERYYIAQLNDRKTQLAQLAPAATAEWARELVGLDSSYQQLKRELPRHPQPDVVLTAMNRNLQIRLDILDRQLELHGTDPTKLAGGAGSDYSLADSRVVADNAVPRHAR
ncbi:hypothetical protein [Hymenobacter psoromatis]|uniref:hypothetical protein n=1 Tax=Hymenobacter psoromatis TaxID=1484116 RepID=UPI001CC0380B|nr:hypothetical protein [Hymenobacter psoromatis]